MKKINKIFLYTISSLCVIVLAAVHAIAQQALTDTLPESAYNLQVPKRVINIYSSFVPYVLFGLLAIGILYVSYRYWADNRPDHHDLSNHHLQH